MNDNTVVIVQARMGSTRLPGKILKPLNGFPVLEHVLERCVAIVGRGQVVCAGVDDPAEAPVRALTERLNIEFFAGSESDVLSRYYEVAKRRGAEWVVRVTSDCPLLDPEVCRGLVEATINGGYDFGITEGWPHGLDCEVISFDWLERSFQQADSAEDREHVTLWAKKSDALRRLTFKPEVPIADVFRYRWVVDYPEDYELLCTITESLAITPYAYSSFYQVQTFMQNHPEYFDVNRKRIDEWAAAYEKLISHE